MNQWPLCLFLYLFSVLVVFWFVRWISHWFFSRITLKEEMGPHPLFTCLLARLTPFFISSQWQRQDEVREIVTNAFRWINFKTLNCSWLSHQCFGFKVNGERRFSTFYFNWEPLFLNLFWKQRKKIFSKSQFKVWRHEATHFLFH